LLRKIPLGIVEYYLKQNEPVLDAFRNAVGIYHNNNNNNNNNNNRKPRQTRRNSIGTTNPSGSSLGMPFHTNSPMVYDPSNSKQKRPVQ